MFIISVCLHSNCMCAVGYDFLGACYWLMLERKTTFEQMQGIHQVREAYTKSVNILLFYSNCDDQEILEGEIFSSTCHPVHNNFTDCSVEGPCCYIWHDN